MKKNKWCLYLAGMALILSVACSKDEAEPVEPDPEVPQWVHEPDSSKVLIIGIDGCLNTAIIPELMPNLYTLAQTSWFSTNAIALTPTWSSTGWASIMTGTAPDKHRYLLNEWTESQTRLTTYPAFFKYLKALKPAWRTSSVVAWGTLHNFLIKSDMVTMRYSSSSDASVENKAKEELALEYAPEAMFVHFDGVDHVGHDASAGAGYDINGAKYRAAVTEVDQRVGRLLAAVKARPNYTEERWLIVVVTDHGGKGTGHGGSSYEEMNAFILLNGPGVTPALVNTPPVITPVPVESDADGFVVYKDGVYASLPQLPALDFGTEKSFTIEMDVRLDLVNGDDPCFFGNKDWTSGANAGLAFVSRSQGQLMINVADGAGKRVDLRCDGVLADKQWHRISFTYDRANGQVALYIDGVKRDNYSSVNGDLSTFATMGSLNSSHSFKLAQDGTGGYGSVFKGGVKELRVFSGVAVDGATVVAYHSKQMDDQHPNIADLVMYNPGAFSGLTLAGGLGKPALTLTTGAVYDYGNAPHLYDIVPTIFNFYGLPIKPEYQWDGTPLLMF